MIPNVQVEAGDFGPKAVVTGSWSRDITAFIAANDIRCLELNQGRGWRGGSLAFLSDLQGLESFAIIDMNIASIEEVHDLRKLRSLTAITYCKTPLRCESFPFLQRLDLEWRRGSQSVFDCPGLLRLVINRYSGKDAIPFGQLRTLESLSILNAPIETITGLSPLLSLRKLRLARLTRLASLHGIEPLSQLEWLAVHTCKRVGSIAPVAGLLGLRYLLIDNDGSIESLAPLRGLRELETVSFYESTNIQDGDLSPLTRLPRLEKVAFQNRRHYTHRREELPMVRGLGG